MIPTKLFCLISLLFPLATYAAAPINFKNITSTNVLKTNDIMLVDSDLGGGNYATRTVPVALVGNTVANTNYVSTTNTSPQTMAGALIVPELTVSAPISQMHSDNGSGTTIWTIQRDNSYPQNASMAFSAYGGFAFGGGKVAGPDNSYNVTIGSNGAVTAPSFDIPLLSLGDANTNLVVDFSTLGFRTANITNDTWISVQNMPSTVARTIEYVLYTGDTNRNVIWQTGLSNSMGAPLPAVLPSNNVVNLTLRSIGTTVTNVHAYVSWRIP